MKTYCMKYKIVLTFALVMGVLYSIATTWIAIILRDVIDTAMNDDQSAFFEQITIAFWLILLVCVSYFLHSLCSKRFIIQVIRSLRADIFQNILKKNYEDFSRVNTADYISSLSNDVKLVEENYFVPLFLCLNNVIQFVASFLIMLALSPLVTLCLVISMVFMIVIPSLFQKALQKRQDVYSRKLSDMTIQIKDFLSGYQVIRSYQMSEHVDTAFARNNDETMKSKYAWDKINAVVEALSTFLGTMVQCSVLFVSAYLIIRGELSAGTLVGLVQISGMIAMPIQMISTNLPKIQGTKLIIDKLQEHIHYESTGFKGTTMPFFEKTLAMHDVSFAYQENVPVVDHIDVIIEKHKKYAIIGKSGCGKTTLINLLTGCFDKYQGTISYDGQELSNLNICEVSKLSAIIHQGVYMFDDTIEHNICLYKTRSEEQLQYALQMSGVASFLDENKGLQAPVGENGANLSGGQRQRIAVARALVQEKPILILDEGTSAIDKQTAYDIESKLLRLDALTMITITHTLDSELLSKYDEIIFMDNGHIVAKDTFANLMSEKKAFYDFFHLKTS